MRGGSRVEFGATGDADVAYGNVRIAARAADVSGWNGDVGYGGDDGGASVRDGGRPRLPRPLLLRRRVGEDGHAEYPDPGRHPRGDSRDPGRHAFLRLFPPPRLSQRALRPLRRGGHSHLPPLGLRIRFPSRSLPVLAALLTPTSTPQTTRTCTECWCTAAVWRVRTEVGRCRS